MPRFAINQSDSQDVFDNLVKRGYRNALKRVGCNGRYQLVMEGSQIISLNRMPDAKYPRGGDQDFTEPAVIPRMLRKGLRTAYDVHQIGSHYATFIREGLQSTLVDLMWKRENSLLNPYLPEWNGLNIEPYRIKSSLNFTIYHIGKEDGRVTVIYDCIPSPSLQAVWDPDPPVSLDMLFG